MSTLTVIFSSTPFQPTSNSDTAMVNFEMELSRIGTVSVTAQSPDRYTVYTATGIKMALTPIEHLEVIAQVRKQYLAASVANYRRMKGNA